jgi:hypothetical protein
VEEVPAGTVEMMRNTYQKVVGLSKIDHNVSQIQAWRFRCPWRFLPFFSSVDQNRQL